MPSQGKRYWSLSWREQTVAGSTSSVPQNVLRKVVIMSKEKRAKALVGKKIESLTEHDRNTYEILGIVFTPDVKQLSYVEGLSYFKELSDYLADTFGAPCIYDSRRDGLSLVAKPDFGYPRLIAVPRKNHYRIV